MSKEENLEVIQSIIRAELYHEAGHEPGWLPPPVVTISRFHGSNDQAIAAELAGHLEVQLYDKQLLEKVIQEACGDPVILAKLDERVPPLLDELLYEFFSLPGANTNDYYYHLARVIVGVAKQGGVIVGRGAHLLLPKGRAFRLRLEGSMAVCSRRIAAEMGVSLKRAREIIVETNHQREAFVRATFLRYPHQKAYYDMVLNTDLFSTREAVEVILVAMRATGFKVPTREPVVAVENHAA